MEDDTSTLSEADGSKDRDGDPPETVTRSDTESETASDSLKLADCVTVSESEMTADSVAESDVDSDTGIEADSDVDTEALAGRDSLLVTLADTLFG